MLRVFYVGTLTSPMSNFVVFHLHLQWRSSRWWLLVHFWSAIRWEGR